MAFDAKTGKKVYEFNTGSGIVGSPVTWEMASSTFPSCPAGGCGPLWGGEVAKRIKGSTRAAWSGPSSCRRTGRQALIDDL